MDPADVNPSSSSQLRRLGSTISMGAEACSHALNGKATAGLMPTSPDFPTGSNGATTGMKGRGGSVPPAPAIHRGDDVRMDRVAADTLGTGISTVAGRAGKDTH